MCDALEPTKLISNGENFISGCLAGIDGEAAHKGTFPREGNVPYVDWHGVPQVYTFVKASVGLFIACSLSQNVFKKYIVGSGH